MEPFAIGELYTTLIEPNLQVRATIFGSHLTKEPKASSVLTKWWNWEPTFATNFGNDAKMVTKVGGQILATKLGFCTRLPITGTNIEL